MKSVNKELVVQVRMLVSGIGRDNGQGKWRMDFRCVMVVDLIGLAYGLGTVDSKPDLDQYLSPEFLP